jgi:hypothetical protein
MRISTVVKAVVAPILVGMAIAPVTPAAAQSSGETSPDGGGISVKDADHGQIVLRRVGERAVPFDPVVGPPERSVLRRDGSKAAPFISDRDPSTAGTGSDGFDWGDAAIGAAGAVVAMLLASTARAAAQRRRRSGVHPTVAT